MAVLLILLLPVAYGASYWLVGVVRRYALAAEVVDLPNVLVSAILPLDIFDDA